MQQEDTIGNSQQGNENSIQMDALTLFDTLTKAAVEGTPIDDRRKDAIHAQRGLLASLDAGTIRQQLLRLLGGAEVLPVLLEYGDVLAVVIPEIEPALGFDQKSPWHVYDVWEHTARALAEAPKEEVLVRLALLFHDLGKPICFSVDETGRGHFYGHPRVGALIAQRRMKALGFDTESIEIVTELIFLHLDALTPDKADNWLMRLGEAQLRRLLALKRADSLAHHEDAIEKRIEKLKAFSQALEALYLPGKP